MIRLQEMNQTALQADHGSRIRKEDIRCGPDSANRWGIWHG